MRRVRSGERRVWVTEMKGRGRLVAQGIARSVLLLVLVQVATRIMGLEVLSWGVRPGMVGLGD